MKQNGKNQFSFYQQINYQAPGSASIARDLRQIADSLRQSGSYAGALDLNYRDFSRQYEYMNQLIIRSSCRCYLDKMPEPEALNAVLEAGTWAPTGMGRQSPVIVCIQNKAARDTLSKMNAAVMGGNGDPFYGAPCVAVVLVDKTIPTCVEDGSLVMGNMLNAAESVGLSACWIHRAKEMFETAEGQALLKKWGVPNAENLRGVGNCILGYAAEGGKKAPAPRKENYVVLVK